MKRIGQAGQRNAAVLSLAVLARWSLQTEHILRYIKRDEAPRPDCLGASRAVWWRGRSVGRNQLQIGMYNSRDRMQAFSHPRSADAHTDAIVEVPHTLWLQEEPTLRFEWNQHSVLRFVVHMVSRAGKTTAS